MNLLSTAATAIHIVFPVIMVAKVWYFLKRVKSAHPVKKAIADASRRFLSNLAKGFSTTTGVTVSAAKFLPTEYVLGGVVIDLTCGQEGEETDVVVLRPFGTNAFTDDVKQRKREKTWIFILDQCKFVMPVM